MKCRTPAARFAEALARDRGGDEDHGWSGALVRSCLRGRDARSMGGSARVLLATLSVRTSARGRPYLSGFLGRARVVAFEGKPDKWGNATWDIFVAEPGPKAARSNSEEQPS